MSSQREAGVGGFKKRILCEPSDRLGVPLIRSQMRGLRDGAVGEGSVSFLELLTLAISINYHVRPLSGRRSNLYI